MKKNNNTANILNIFASLISSYSISGVCEDLPSSSVRLPGIYHILKEDAQNKPTITIEEIEKCMGQDNNIRQKYDYFQSETKLINDEVMVVENQVKENDSARLIIEKEVTVLNAETAQMNSRGEVLDKKKLELTALTSKKVDSAAAKKINSQIDQFNKEVKLQNADSSALNERIRLFKEKQKIFNESLTPLKLKLEYLNDKTTQFNNRKKSFNDTLMTYSEKCTGERRLEK
ncbi:hypothetical protein [Methylotenera sp.]|uniref:hypothetical protein n=1 Tax=Methylotenera sp. TaxID=2051956 RepID=UPI00248A3F6B|nr:hypothetical protein [Methylotenera sp.]MDI1363186.1 hypothetical protein [Methylotenera sp.]